MKREEALAAWEQARANADLILTNLEKEGRVEFDHHSEEERMARACLRGALIMALSPMKDKQAKISYARIVLEWTRQVNNQIASQTARC
jgi:hypothetical protein